GKALLLHISSDAGKMGLVLFLCNLVPFPDKISSTNPRVIDDTKARQGEKGDSGVPGSVRSIRKRTPRFVGRRGSDSNRRSADFKGDFGSGRFIPIKQVGHGFVSDTGTGKMYMMALSGGHGINSRFGVCEASFVMLSHEVLQSLILM
ncbi:hypothetical protein XENOCAPTIV_021148, partial [Xenoophorus captivus]